MQKIVKTVKVLLKDANQIKEFIVKNGHIDKDFSYKKDNEHIFFPIKDGASAIKKRFGHVQFENKQLKYSRKETKLKRKLKDNFSEKEIEKLKTSFDVVGDIAILEIDNEFFKKEKIIAETLLEMHKNINTVVKKRGIHEGTYRAQDVKWIAGEKKTVTIHKENNIKIKLDVGKVYFSSRLSTERKRIAGLVKNGESVLVMFSGCGPYVFVMAKNTDSKEVVGIEINPLGHKYALENQKLNKARNVKLHHGDVKKVLPTLDERFDRIIMPLPKSASNFLGIALSAAKKGTVVHFYDFLQEKDIPESAIKKIEHACKKAKLAYKVLDHTRCGQHSPRVYRVCVDFRII